MATAQIAEIAPTIDQESQIADAQPADAPLAMPDKVVAMLFLIGVSLFGLISVVDLVANFFR
jgi:hypothetical protein